MNAKFPGRRRSLLQHLLGTLLVLAAAPASTCAAPGDSRLANLSTRAQVSSGANIMVTGFVIGDSGSKKILLRAVGPGLAGFAVGGALADPVLSLYDSHGQLLNTNSSWFATDAPTMTGVGAFPLSTGSRDAAIVTTLPPGLYTAQVSSAGGATGVALLEAYDVSGAPRLINISTRALIGSGNDSLIAGLVIAPGNGARHVLVRAAGPALAAFQLAGANPDPALAVLDASGRQIAANDDWGTANSAGELDAAFTQAGAFSFSKGSKDAALVTALPPGSYSVVVSGVGGAGGVALVEIYDLDGSSGPVPPTPTASAPLFVSYLRASPAASGSTAYGTATIELGDDEKSAVVNVTLANLSSAEVTAHLLLDGNFVFGLPQGNVDAVNWPFAPAGPYSSGDLIAALKAGRISISIDSAKNPAGELGGTFVRNSAGAFVVPAAPPALDLGTVTPQDAARFLTQATFGATATDITDLVKQGYAAWITGQMALSPTPQRAYTMDDFAANNLGGQGPPVNGIYPYPGGVHRQAAWWKIAITSPDQLRQRIAFALSEIFVVSDQDANLNTWQEGLANYYDVLVADAFGNFRTLLEDVTLHPIMGVYLSALRNGRGAVDPNGVALTSPNENYAREIMQLFTIGLNELNPDGSLRLDASGQLIPTYDQDTIVETAKVFTGWGFYSTDGNRNFHTTGGSQPRDWTTPMMLYPDYHEDSAKTIIGGRVLPAGQGGAKDLKDTLDALFQHPNTGPFISRQLIQRLVKSNPSPSYVYRVAQVFADNGAGVRGDLAAVVRAILLDYEARSSALLAAPGQGKLKEPILRATAFMRACGARSDSGRYNIDAYPSLAQAPLRAPTVFNFFEPDFVRSGALASAGLFSPEYEILTDTTSITTANFYDLYINNPRPAAPSAETRDVVYLQLEPLLPLARSPQALVAQLNLVLAANALSKSTTDLIVGALNALPDSASDSDRLRTAIYLVVNAPEGATQK